MTKLLRVWLSVIASLLFMSMTNAQGLPEFSLKCNDANNQTNYRLASNGSEIYFAHIDKSFGVSDTKKSTDNFIEPRVIIMSFQDSSAEPRRPRMALDEDSAHEFQGILARDTLILRLGKYKYVCEKITDNEMFAKLKLAYENSVLEAMEKQKIYNNRPNQL